MSWMYFCSGYKYWHLWARHQGIPRRHTIQAHSWSLHPSCWHWRHWKHFWGTSHLQESQLMASWQWCKKYSHKSWTVICSQKYFRPISNEYWLEKILTVQNLHSFWVESIFAVHFWQCFFFTKDASLSLSYKCYLYFSILQLDLWDNQISF